MENKTEAPELQNIPDDLQITDVFLHVTPPEVAANPELRARLIEHYREERRLFVEDNVKGKRVKKAKAKTKEEVLDAKVGD